MLTLKAGLKLRSKFGNFVNKISLWKRQILSVSLILVELSKIPLKILLVTSKIRLSSITDQKSNTMPKTTSCNGNVCHPQTILISCTKTSKLITETQTTVKTWESLPQIACSTRAPLYRRIKSNVAKIQSKHKSNLKL